MKRLLTIAVLTAITAICALSAFACMPPFWGGEEEMPDDFLTMYKGKKSGKKAPNFLMKGYERKLI